MNGCHPYITKVNLDILVRKVQNVRPILSSTYIDNIRKTIKNLPRT